MGMFREVPLTMGSTMVMGWCTQPSHGAWTQVAVPSTASQTE